MEGTPSLHFELQPGVGNRKEHAVFPLENVRREERQALDECSLCYAMRLKLAFHRLNQEPDAMRAKHY